VTSQLAIESTPLTDRQATQVHRLVGAAPGAADNPPLNERTLLHLTAPAPFRHFVVESNGSIVGYAQIDGGLHPASAELVTITPNGLGVADALIHAVEHAGTAVRLWAHADASAAFGAASRAGWLPVRTLLQLRRTLDYVAPPAEIPDGVTIRPFVPGDDDAAWLAVNARAFATHPEQGSWTQVDLDDRMRSDWFDPAGFLVAERQGELIGYHWTKVHAETEPPIGEVYILGLDPTARGIGLGPVLLDVGLAYLRDRGLSAVLLYVEAENTTALRIYHKAGFTIYSRDTQYAPPTLA